MMKLASTGAVIAFVVLSGCSGGKEVDKAHPESPAHAAHGASACAALKSADLSALLTEATFIENSATHSADVALSHCTASDKDGSRSISLLMRRQLTNRALTSSTEQRVAYPDELRLGYEGEVALEDVPVGEAAVWFAAVGQLTVWNDDGRVMMIFSASGDEQKGAALFAARAVLRGAPH